MSQPASAGNAVSAVSPSPPRRGRIRGALRNSFIDGVLSSFGAALLDGFAIAAILALGAGSRSVAVLVGTAGVLSSLAQLLSPRLTELAPSRRVMSVRCARLQAAAAVLFAAAGFLVPRATAGHAPAVSVLSIAAAVLAYTVYSVGGCVMRGAWASWMVDLVPHTHRGRYFSWRGAWLGGIHGATVLAAGTAFRGIWGASVTPPWAAFAALFVLAGVCRYAASGFIARQYEPRATVAPRGTGFTYWQFLARTGRSNFATFTVCLALLNAGASLTGPFFQVYFLRDLKGLPIGGVAGAASAGLARALAAAGVGSGTFELTFDLSTYVWLPTTALLFRLMFVRIWGRIADRWGTLIVMRVCAALLSFIPLLYLGAPRFDLMFLGWITGGIVWGGLDLSSFNYAMEAVTPAQRVRCLSYMEGTVGLGVALYAFAGGWLAEHLPAINGYRMQALFLLSVVLRVLPSLGLFVLVREVRAAHRSFSLASLFRPRREQ